MDQLDTADLPELGGDVDDDALASRQHRRHDGLGHQEGAAHMHRKHPVEILKLEVFECCLMRNTGIVDEKGDVAVRGLGSRMDSRHILGPCYVAGDRGCHTARLGDFRGNSLGPVAREVVDQNSIAVGGQAKGDSSTNTRAGAGDDGRDRNGNLLSHHASSWMRTRLARLTDRPIRIA